MDIVHVLFRDSGDRDIVNIDRHILDQMTIHDISLNPSYRGENIGFQMLNELQAKYPDVLIHPTDITEAYLSRWINENKEE